MSNFTYIDCKVRGDEIICDKEKVIAGDSVKVRAIFDESWAGITKYAAFLKHVGGADETGEGVLENGELDVSGFFSDADFFEFGFLGKDTEGNIIKDTNVIFVMVDKGSYIVNPGAKASNLTFIGRFSGVEATANEAKAQSEDAKSISQNANSTSEDAKSIAEDAKRISQNASSTSEEAKSIAEDAKRISQNANSASQEAKNIAEDAKSISQNASSTSEDAKSISQNANSTSEDAKSIAEDAKRISQNANSTSEDAKSISQNANSASQEAKSIAEDAKSISQNANLTAEDANSIAKDAKDIAEDVEKRANMGEFKGDKGDKGSKGDKGDKGDTGNSGVYLGSGDMPEDCNVQIDPEGEVFEITQEKGDSETKVMSQKVVTDAIDAIEAKADSNTIKGNASGGVIRVDDVNPLEHNLDVKVRSRNLVNISGATKEGILVDNGDGTFTLTKISANDRISNLVSVSIPANTPYWIDFEVVEATGKITRPVVLIKYADNSVASPRYNDTMYIEDKDIIGIQLFASPSADDGNYVIFKNFQIVIGDTAPTIYTPCIDPTTVTVTKCRKNMMIPNRWKNTTTNGFAAVVNGDGTVTISGSAAESIETKIDIALVKANGTIGAIPLVANQEYTVTVWKDGKPIEYGNYSLRYVKEEGGNEYGECISSSKPYNRKINRVNINYTPVVGDTSICGTYKVQLECGSGTDYEQYYSEDYTPNADGTLDIVSVSPTMSLLTDTFGATIDLKYNRDINKVIASLEEKITAMIAAMI